MEFSKYEGHSPGPWRVAGRGVAIYSGEDSEDRDAVQVAELDHSGGSFCANPPKREEIQANARLIADAPTLAADLAAANAEISILRDNLAVASSAWDIVNADLAAANKRIARLEGALREVEWGSWDGMALESECPSCGALRDSNGQHRDDCSLAAVLAPAGREGEVAND